MAENSLAPGFVLLYYTSNGHQHKMTLPTQPQFNGLGEYWELPNRLGATQNWTDRLDDYVAVLAPMLAVDSTIDYAELWTESATTGVRQFHAVYAIGEDGTVSGDSTPYAQTVVNFRTSQGGLLRSYILEGGAVDVDQLYTPPYTGMSALTSYVNFFLGANNPFIGRDGGFPIASTRTLTKTNDALRKKYML